MHLHLIDLDNAVNDGVDRESAYGVNVQFARDVFAVREDRVDRQEEMRRNLLVGKPFDDVSDDSRSRSESALASSSLLGK